jgi:tetratricopeptide (TPR) repeat protein
MMRRFKHNWMTICSIATAALYSLAVDAAIPEARLLIDSDSFYVGDSFGLTIAVANLQEPDEPDMSVITNALVTPMAIHISPTGTTHSLHYLVTPKVAGSLVIPPLTVANIETTASTAETILDVKEPEQTDDFKLMVTLSTNICYAGEAISLDVRWESSIPFSSIKSLDMTIPAMQERAFQVYTPSPESMIAEKDTVGLPVNRTRVIARQLPSATLFSRTLTIAKPGKYRIPGGMLICSVEESGGRRSGGFQYPSYFDNQFFKNNLRGEFRKLYVRTPPLTLTVLPLPTENQPASFQGLIGACTMQTSLTPAEAQLGDPLSFQLTFSDHPHPEILSQPDLSVYPNIRQGFEIVEGKLRSRQTNGQRIFTYTLLPRRIGKNGFPPFELSGFDPATAAYYTLRSPRLELDVGKATVAKASDALLSDGTTLAGDMEEVPDGIYAADSMAVILAEGHHARGSLFDRFSWIVFLPPIAWLLFRWATSRHRFRLAYPVEARHREALKAFRRRIRHVPSSSLHYEIWLSHVTALRHYLADVLNASPGALSWSDLEQELTTRHVPAEQRHELKKIFEKESRQKYSHHTQPLPQQHGTGIPRLVERISQYFCILLVLLAAGAWTASSIPDTNLPRTATQLMNDAIQAEADGRLERSKQLYERAALTLDELYLQHNNGPAALAAGNAWYQAGNMGRAILQYRRAAWHMPHDHRVQHNLNEARSQTSAYAPPALSPLLSIAQAGQSQPLLNWILTLFAVCWIGVWLGMMRWLYDRSVWLQTCLVSGFAVALICAGFILADQGIATSVRHGVIIEDQVLPRKGDNPIFEAAFSNELQNGTEVLIMERRGSWTRIRIQGGLTGWIPSSSVEALF